MCGPVPASTCACRATRERRRGLQSTSRPRRGTASTSIGCIEHHIRYLSTNPILSICQNPLPLICHLLLPYRYYSDFWRNSFLNTDSCLSISVPTQSVVLQRRTERKRTLSRTPAMSGQRNYFGRMDIFNLPAHIQKWLQQNGTFVRVFIVQFWTEYITDT